jgi:hypothetical protein
MQQASKSIQVVRNGENIRSDFTFRADDEAVVFILGNIDSNKNHYKTSDGKIVMLHPQNTLLRNLVSHKPFGGI